MDTVYERDALTGYYYKICNGTKTRVSRNESLSQIGGARVNMSATPAAIASQTPWVKTARADPSDIVVTYEVNNYDDDVDADDVIARMESDLPYPVNGMEWFKAAGVEPHHVREKCQDAGKPDTVGDIVNAWGTKLLEPEPARDPISAEKALRDDDYVIDGVADVVKMPSKDMENYERTVKQPAAKDALKHCRLLDGGDENALVAREKDMCTYELTCNKNLGLPEGIRTDDDYARAITVNGGKYSRELTRCKTIDRWKCGEARQSEQYISSNEYQLIHNTGEGDCLFIAYTNWLHIKEQLDRGETTVWSMTDATQDMAGGITQTIHAKLKANAHKLRNAAVKWITENQNEVFPRFGQIKYFVVKGAFAQYGAGGASSYGINEAVAEFNALPSTNRLDDAGTEIIAKSDDVAIQFVAHINNIGSLRGSTIPGRRQLATTVDRFVDILLKHYCKEMQKVTTYATDVEILALSQLYQNTVKVYLTVGNIRERLRNVISRAKARGDVAAQTEAQSELARLTDDMFGSYQGEYVYTDDTSDEAAPVVRIYNYNQSHYELVINKKTNGGDTIELMEPRVAALKNILETHFEHIDDSGDVDEMGDLINDLIQGDDLTVAELAELATDLNWTARAIDDPANYAETLASEVERVLHLKNMRSLFSSDYYNHPDDLVPIKDDVAKMLDKIKAYAAAQPDVGKKFVTNSSNFDPKTVGLVLSIMRPEATYDKLGASIVTIPPNKLPDTLVDQPGYFHKMFSIVGIDGYIRDPEGFNEPLLELMARLFQCYNSYPQDTLKELKSWMVKLALMYYDQDPSAHKNKKPTGRMSFYELAKYLYDDGGSSEFALDKAIPGIVAEKKGSISRDFDLYEKLAEVLGGILEPSEIEDMDAGGTDRQLIETLVDNDMFNDEFAEEVTDGDIITTFEGSALNELIKQMKIEFVLSKVYTPIDSKFRSTHSPGTRGFKLDYQLDAEYYMVGKLRELIVELMGSDDPTELRTGMTFDKMLKTWSTCKEPIPDGMSIYEHTASNYNEEVEVAEPLATKITKLLEGTLDEEDVKGMLADNGDDAVALMEQLADLDMLTPLFEKEFADEIKTKFEGAAHDELLKQIKVELALRHVGQSAATESIQASAEERMIEKLKALIPTGKDKVPTKIQLMNAFGRCKELSDDENIYSCAAKSVGKVRITLKKK